MVQKKICDNKQIPLLRPTKIWYWGVWYECVQDFKREPWTEHLRGLEL